MTYSNLKIIINFKNWGLEKIAKKILPEPALVSQMEILHEFTDKICVWPLHPASYTLPILGYTLRTLNIIKTIQGDGLVIAKDVKSCTYCCCYVRCATLIVGVGEMPWTKTGTTHYHAKLRLSDKGDCARCVGLVPCCYQDGYRAKVLQYPQRNITKDHLDYYHIKCWKTLNRGKGEKEM